MSFPRSLLGWLFGLLATFIWGTFYPVSRLLAGPGGDAVDPLSYSFLRFLLATLALSPILLKRETRMLAKKMLLSDFREMALLALIGILGEGLLVFWSTKYTTAARSSLMANTSPATTLILAWLLGRDLLTRRKLAGILLGLAGMVFFFFAEGQDRFLDADASLWIGDLLAFGSGCCWATFTVLGDRFSEKYGGVLSSLMFFATATILMLPITLALNGGRILWQFTPEYFLNALYLGAVGGGIAIACWYAALQRVSPGRLGSLGYLSASIAIVSSLLLTGERLNWLFLTALVCVMSGMALMAHKAKSEK